MPYDEADAVRVRKLMRRRKGFSEKKMFGGVGFLLHGNMCCGVWREFLVLRVGPKAWQPALDDPYAREFDITGRSMTGWVMIEPQGYDRDDDLKDWVRLAVRFSSKLPPKEGT